MYIGISSSSKRLEQQVEKDRRWHEECEEKRREEERERWLARLETVMKEEGEETVLFLLLIELLCSAYLSCV